MSATVTEITLRSAFGISLLVIGATGIVACGTPSHSGDAGSPEPTPAGQPAISEAKPSAHPELPTGNGRHGTVEAQPAEVRDLDMAGLGGYALERAFAVHGGLTGTWPASMEDLAPYYPWLPLYEGFEWAYALNRETGLQTPVAQRNIPDDIISTYLKGQNVVSQNGGDKFDPPLGVFGDTERYLIRWIDQPQPTPAELEWLPIEASSRFTKIPSTAELHPTYELAGVQLNQRDYLNIMTGAVIDHKADMLSWAMINARGLNPAGVPAHSFQELLDWYGGALNPAFWVNPYTGAPMQDVPLTARTAGDYTTLPDERGLQIAFHYLDFVGEVSTIVVGAVGTMDECCNLDTILPPQESSPQ